ncbi:MAG: GyrI-like domain-containing protein [Treponema sp.]|jgi:predicted transcriptional regulator YdeE|nr:GyrI-like domain-containing protein [Treponema sp.]
MEPKIVKMDKLTIIGLTGNGVETGKVWSDFEEFYVKKPFSKTDENSYEIRFYDDEQKVTQGMDIHVGFLTLNTDNLDGFKKIVLPATEYAVFDVYVANGYDSENKNIDKWLSDNTDKYTQLQIEGKKYVVECYNEKFKGGDKSDSTVEIWIPLKRVYSL